MSSHYLGFIWYRSIAQLRSESSRAYLGYLWWFLEPLLYLLVFYIVFALVFARGGEDYVQILLTGLVVWKWFDSSIRGSMDVIQQNAGLIDKVYLPKVVLPAVSVTANGIKFFLVFILLCLFSAFLGSGLALSWLALPALFLVHALLVFACASLVAAITPFIPDIRMLFDKFMTLLFFLSGIFYSIESIPQALQGYFLLNPAFSLIEQYRQVMVDQQWPAITSLLYVSAFSVVVLLVALALLKRFDRLYPRLIY